MQKDSKPCAHCGRSFEYRKKWEKTWDQVKYCSDRCRGDSKSSGKRNSQRLQELILEKLQTRKAGLTICPSEVLEAAQKQQPPEMEKVRQAARLLVHQGKIEILQGGKIIDPDDFRGPIRLRLK